MAVFTTQV